MNNFGMEICMKKIVAKRLSVIIIVGMCIILIANLFVQVNVSIDNIEKSSKFAIEQINHIINVNNAELESEEMVLKEEYISRARMAAYILDHHSEAKDDIDKLKEIAEIIDVDELHLFDVTGRIVFGTEPKYYNFTVNDGEQISYFKEMLDSKDKELCQDVTPNTAEAKPMMYAAVWLNDESGFVQVGIEPIRFIEAMKKNELDYVFSRMAMDEDCEYYAIDKKTNVVVASTLKKSIGEELDGVDITQNLSKIFGATIFDAKSYCYFEEFDDYYVGVIHNAEDTRNTVFGSMLVVFAYLFILTVMIIIVIIKIIDINIIKGIDKLVASVQDISDGNLNTIIEVDNSPEFVTLSNNINKMTESILNNTVKLSNVLNTADILIAVYEYHDGSEKVLTTGNISAVLCLSSEQEAELVSDKEKFKDKIKQICDKKVEGYDDVYQVDGISTTYLKLNEHINKKETYGIITDVTEEINEKISLQYERDYDLLTELYNRRAFYRELDEFKDKPEEVKESVLMMFDLDRLKFINDNYGHAYGDEAIRKAAQIVSSVDTDKKIAARVSGDEFVIFIYGADSKEELKEYIEHMYEIMRESYINVREEVVPIRVSGGYIFCEDRPIEHSTLLELADIALYESKRGGRGRFTEYISE